MYPPLSIVIPCYNSEPYIENCIKSLVTDLNFSDFELILVDDGSTDNTLERIKFIASNFANVKYLTQTNQGQGAARNRGLELARGKYIGFIDSDDRVSEQYFSNLLATAEEVAADVVICNIISVSGEGNEDPTNSRPYPIDQFASLDLNNSDNRIWIIRKFLLDRISVSPCNKIMRREMIRDYRIRFPEGKLNEDMKFCFDLICHAKVVIKANNSSYFYIQREFSSTKRCDSRVLDMLPIVDSIRGNIPLELLSSIKNEFLFFDLFFACYLTFMRSLFSNHSDRKQIKKSLLKRTRGHSMIEIWKCLDLRYHHKSILLLFRWFPNSTYFIVRSLKIFREIRFKLGVIDVRKGLVGSA